MSHQKLNVNKIKKNYIIAGFLLLFLNSCNVINKKEKEPIYVTIDKIKGQNQDREISNSHNVVDVWITTREISAGVHSIPGVFPVLPDGEDDLILEAGIYTNGLSNQKQKYFFYKPILIEVKEGETKKLDLNPNFEYVSGAVFSELGSDDFESSVRKYVSEHESNSLKYISGEEAFEGSSAVLTNERENETPLGVITKTPFKIENDKVNAPVYLEFDIKSSVVTEIGIRATLDDQNDELTIININETNGVWKHLYIDLIDEVNNASSQVLWEVYFRSDSTNIDDYISLDNVRILYSE